MKWLCFYGVVRDISLKWLSVGSPEDAAEPKPEALLGAIFRRDEVAALSLLQRPRLPGLNLVDDWGRPVLYRALARSHSDVALAILARADFQAVNVKSQWGATALHQAAVQGLLPVCRAIVGRADFVELQAVGSIGRGPETALEVAQRKGHQEVVEFLHAAEAGRA